MERERGKRGWRERMKRERELIYSDEVGLFVWILFLLICATRPRPLITSDRSTCSMLVWLSRSGVKQV